MKAAFLDLDGTLCDGSSSAFLLRELAKEPGVHREYLDAALEAADRKEKKGPSTLRGGIYKNYPPAVKGLDISQVTRAAMRAWPAFRKTMFDFVPDLVQLLHSEGFEVVLVTGGPEELARHVRAEYGMSATVGARLETEALKCTGRLAQAPAQAGGKSEYIRSTLAYGLDLEESFSMGNGIRDAEMMELTGSAVAFEPEFDLAPLAETNGWPVADRSDVLEVCERALTG